MDGNSKSTTATLRALVLVAFAIATTIVCEDPPSGPETQIELPAAGPTPPHQAANVPTNPPLAWPGPNVSELHLAQPDLKPQPK